MHSAAVYYLCLFVLLLAMLASWGATLFALPGNWGIVLSAVVFAFLFPASDGRGSRWTAVAIAAVLAVVGEIIELAAGAAGARRAGASRRSAVFAPWAPSSAASWARWSAFRSPSWGRLSEHSAAERRRLCRRISGRDSHRPRPPAKRGRRQRRRAHWPPRGSGWQTQHRRRDDRRDPGRCACSRTYLTIRSPKPRRGGSPLATGVSRWDSGPSRSSKPPRGGDTLRSKKDHAGRFHQPALPSRLQHKRAASIHRRPHESSTLCLHGRNRAKKRRRAA